MGKLYPKRLSNKEIKKPELKFNPGLAQIGLRTLGVGLLPTLSCRNKMIAQSSYFSHLKVIFFSLSTFSNT